MSFLGSKALYTFLIVADLFSYGWAIAFVLNKWTIIFKQMLFILSAPLVVQDSQTTGSSRFLFHNIEASNILNLQALNCNFEQLLFLSTITKFANFSANFSHFDSKSSLKLPITLLFFLILVLQLYCSSLPDYCSEYVECLVKISLWPSMISQLSST